MNKLVLFSLCAFLAVQVSSKDVVSPRDLADEAAEQLDNLASIVQGQILAAHNNLQALILDFATNSDNTLKEGQIDLEQEHQTILNQITVLEDLAISAGYDVTTCTDMREQLLDRLPEEYGAQMENCIGDVNNEAASIVRDATYIIDININTVEGLRFQLNRCQTEILCITTVVTQIETYMVSLPQAIQREVNSAEELVETLGISTQSCSDQKIAQYAAEATAILGDIEDCINRIIG